MTTWMYFTLGTCIVKLCEEMDTGRQTGGHAGLGDPWGGHQLQWWGHGHGDMDSAATPPSTRRPPLHPPSIQLGFLVPGGLRLLGKYPVPWLVLPSSVQPGQICPKAAIAGWPPPTRIPLRSRSSRQISQPTTHQVTTQAPPHTPRHPLFPFHPTPATNQRVRIRKSNPTARFADLSLTLPSFSLPFSLLPPFLLSHSSHHHQQHFKS